MIQNLILAFACVFDIWPDPRSVAADVWSGDSSADVTEASEVERQGPAAGRSERILYFTVSWCGPCQSFSATSLPALRSAGWTASDSPDSSIQIIDGDAHPDLVARYRVEQYPTFIRVSNDRELRRLVGAVDQWAIGRLFYGADQPAPAASQAVTPAATPRARVRSPGLLDFLFEE